MSMKEKIYRFLKGFFRIQNGFAFIRIWLLNKINPRKTNMHLFDLVKKGKQKIE